MIFRSFLFIVEAEAMGEEGMASTIELFELLLDE
jgi:hypothetical protein